MKTANLKISFLSWLVFTVLAADVSADSVVLKDTNLANGVSLLQAQQWEAAEQKLGLAATNRTEPAVSATAEFYLGLLWQNRAAQAPSPEERARLLAKAAVHYEAASSGLPESGPTLNNLARVRSNLGEIEQANLTIDKALALKDGREGAYLLTKADILAAQQAPLQDQLQQLDKALRAAPENKALQNRFADTALDADPAALAKTARWLLRKGYVDVAERLILKGLPVEHDKRSSLLLYLAETLSKKRYIPSSFSETRTAAVLGSIVDAEDVGSGAQELLSLHAKPSREASTYPWWTVTRPGRRGYLFKLALALSTTQWQEQALKSAQRYAELAVDLADKANPDAILQLANIYASTGQRRRLQRLSTLYVRDLFQGKGDAYASRNDQQIYEYHLALGSIFGYLGQWENNRWQAASAIYQLENARLTAARINRRNNPQTRAKVIVPVAAGELLAKAYVETKQPDKSAVVRLDSAELYRKQGRPELAEAILTVPEAQLKAVLRDAAPVTNVRWQRATQEQVYTVD